MSPPQRFTIAHELGHWMLHKDRTEHSVLPRFKEPYDSPVEHEANTFAENLLMPDRLLPIKTLFEKPDSLLDERQTTYAGYIVNARLLAELFGVPTLVLNARLQNARAAV